jgi:hypothetical protein
VLAIARMELLAGMNGVAAPRHTSENTIRESGLSLPIGLLLIHICIESIAYVCVRQKILRIARIIFDFFS